MFKPFDDGRNYNQERRTRFMLTSRGRVVRVEDVPNTGSDLMVPTEHELKMILYDQADAGNRTHERETIDYVALHANRRPKQKSSSYAVRNRVSSLRDDNDNHRPRVRRQRRTNKLDPDARQRTWSPRDETGEEQGVSTFLDSFSTLGMAHRCPESTLQTADVFQSVFSMHSCQDAMPGRQKRETEYIVDHHTRDTLEMSKPLAQIDLYNILARAPPVEQESTVSHRSPGDICGSGDQAARSKKAHNNVMRSKCQTRGVRGAVDMRSIWRASRAADSKQGEDVGGHLARDPLGDEVAMLQAKVQESLQRVKRAVEKEKPATSIDIARCYGTLLAERSQPLEDPAKKLVQDCEECGIENGGAVDTDVMLPPGVATIKSGDDRADCGGQVSRHLQYGRDIVSEERRRNAQKKPTHGTGNNVKRMSSTCTFEAKPSVDLGDTKWPLGDGDKQGLPTVRPINIYLGHANIKFKKVHLEQKKGDGEEFVSGLTMGDPERKGVANVAAFERKRGSRVVELVEKDSAIAMTKESTKDVLTWVGEDNHDDCPGGEEASPQQPPDGDDVLKSSNSDYREDSFESTDETEESSATVASSTVPEDQISKTGVRAEKNVLINRDEDGDAHGARVYGARQCEASSRSGAITEEEGSRERAAAAAAALQIEACWRGFVGRRAAKWALRSILLNVLRNIGGGKISKVASLADVEREDRRGLNRALRLATQPRHHLPSQAHISACIRFVESLHRRRTGIVEARKKWWLEERRQRRARERKSGYRFTPSALLSAPLARAKSNPECLTRSHQRIVATGVE